MENKTPETRTEILGRNDFIQKVKAALKHRSGKAWSVTGGKGTAWGWVTIDTLPRNRRFDFEDLPTDSEFGYAGNDDRTELNRLLGLEGLAHSQGISIPSGSDYYREYLDRAEGRTPSVFGKQYWD